jgi:hypothetical protein
LDPATIIEEGINLLPNEDENSLTNALSGKVSEEEYYKAKAVIEYDWLICTHTLNNFHPRDSDMYLVVHKLLAFARENEADRDNFLAYGFDKEGNNLGIFLWNVNGGYEYPIFITGSVTDLVNDHVITFTDLEGPYFDKDKYLVNSLQQCMTGYAIRLNFNTDIDHSSEFHTAYKKLISFYETVFKELFRGAISFDVLGDLILVTAEMGDTYRTAYDVTENDLYDLIENLNEVLNQNLGQYCRPTSFGFYVVDKKYLVCVRRDLAAEFIRKGYINGRNKMLPLLAFYNPEMLPQQYEGYKMLAEFAKESNKKITWID